MLRQRLIMGALTGSIWTAPFIAIMYLADQIANLPFVPFDLFNWVGRVLPGPILTFGLDLMIDLMLLLGIDVADSAKTAERAIAVLQFFGIGIAIGVLFFAIMHRRQAKADRAAGLVVGALFGFPMIALSLAMTQPLGSALFAIIWLLVLFLGWGVMLSWGYGRLYPDTPSSSIAEAETNNVETLNRRQFLVRLGASTATITVAGAGVASVLARAEQRRQEEALESTMAHQAEESNLASFPNANDPVIPVPGTRPEYTPIKDHYQVFLETEPTVIDGALWTLPITGLVDNPLMLTLDDIRNNYQSRDQYVTLRCISGRIGTSLIGTTLWTGVSLQAILAEVGVQPEATHLFIRSGDGFYESVALDLINADERIMLCYAWDGHTLPVDHGFPLRIWIPDLYGMKQPKWITSIEVLDEDKDGYWVERNWDKIARVKAVSDIDTVAVDHIINNGTEQLVPIGGMAYTGARGVSKVEVRVNGGPWQEAQLRAPLSETTWVIWRYEWPFEPGNHLFEVRCAEGDGTPQIEESVRQRPNGASGIHSVEIDL